MAEGPSDDVTPKPCRKKERERDVARERGGASDSPEPYLGERERESLAVAILAQVLHLCWEAYSARWRMVEE